MDGKSIKFFKIFLLEADKMDGPEYNLQGNRMLQLNKLFENWQEINEKTLSKHIF